MVDSKEDDLSEVRAKIEWADEQIENLEGQIAAFNGRGPYRLRAEQSRNRPGQDIFFEVSEEIPKALQVNVGAIIHAQRSSLDLLACALAARNGEPDRTDVYFPFAQSEENYLKSGTQKKIKRLSDGDKKIINDLRPYEGGNDELYALHWLDLKDKHRKLIALGSMFGEAALLPGARPGHIRAFAVYAHNRPFESGKRIAYWDADAGPRLQIRLQLVFERVVESAFVPLVPTLRSYSELCIDIVDRF